MDIGEQLDFIERELGEACWPKRTDALVAIEKSLRLVPKLIALREVAKNLFDEWFELEGDPPTATWERLEAALAALDAGEGVDK